MQGWVDPVGLVTYHGGIPARRRSPIPVLTGLNVEQLSSYDERLYHTALNHRSVSWSHVVRFCWSSSASSTRNVLSSVTTFSWLRDTCLSRAILRSSFTTLFTPRVTARDLPHQTVLSMIFTADRARPTLSEIQMLVLITTVLLPSCRTNLCSKPAIQDLYCVHMVMQRNNWWAVSLKSNNCIPCP